MTNFFSLLIDVWATIIAYSSYRAKEERKQEHQLFKAIKELKLRI